MSFNMRSSKYVPQRLHLVSNTVILLGSSTTSRGGEDTLRLPLRLKSFLFYWTTFNESSRSRRSKSEKESLGIRLLLLRWSLIQYSRFYLLGITSKSVSDYSVNSPLSTRFPRLTQSSPNQLPRRIVDGNQEVEGDPDGRTEGKV